jgi:hypothetical protein
VLNPPGQPYFLLVLQEEAEKIRTAAAQAMVSVAGRRRMRDFITGQWIKGADLLLLKDRILFK